MADVLIHDVPEAALSAIDATARQLGVSREEYLRRWLIGLAAPEATVAPEDLDRSTRAFSDLAKPEVMGKPWE